MSLQFQTATERYLKLLQQQPQLLQKASLGMIASYLGISQETLSRIRKKSKQIYVFDFCQKFCAFPLRPLHYQFTKSKGYASN